MGGVDGGGGLLDVAPAGGGGCWVAVPWLMRPGRLRGNMGRDMEVKRAGYDRGLPRRDELGLGVVCAMTMGWGELRAVLVYLVIWRGGLASQQRCGVNWRQPEPLQCSPVSISAQASSIEPGSSPSRQDFWRVSANHGTGEGVRHCRRNPTARVPSCHDNMRTAL